MTDTVVLVVGSCCGAYRTRKSDDDPSLDGIEGFRTAKIQVNKYTSFLSLGSFKTLAGFTRSFFFSILTSSALFKNEIVLVAQTRFLFQQFGRLA